MSLSLRAGGPAGKKGYVVGMWEVLCGPKGISGEGSTLMSGWGAISSRGYPAPPPCLPARLCGLSRCDGAQCRPGSRYSPPQAPPTAPKIHLLFLIFKLFK